jgi:hypothetical protein
MLVLGCMPNANTAQTYRIYTFLDSISKPAGGLSRAYVVRASNHTVSVFQRTLRKLALSRKECKYGSTHSDPLFGPSEFPKLKSVGSPETGAHVFLHTLDLQPRQRWLVRKHPREVRMNQIANVSIGREPATSFPFRGRARGPVVRTGNHDLNGRIRFCRRNQIAAF